VEVSLMAEAEPSSELRPFEELRTADEEPLEMDKQVNQ